MDDPTILEILDDLADGKVSPQYRAAFQQLLVNTPAGKQLQRAIEFQRLKQWPRRFPDPVQTTMDRMNVSRPTVYSSYSVFKSSLESQESSRVSGGTVTQPEEEQA